MNKKRTAQNMKELVPSIIIFSLCLVMYNFAEFFPCSTRLNEGWHNVFLDVLLLFSTIWMLYIIIKRVSLYKSFPIPPIISFTYSLILVVLFYFLYDSGEWQLSHKISIIEVFIGILSVSFVVGGGYVAIRQLKESAQTNKLSSFKFMVESFQEQHMRENRKVVFSLMDSNSNIKPSKLWSEEEEYAAHTILSNIDIIGLMILNGVLDERFLKGWEYSIYKSLYILTDFLNEEKSKYSYKIDGNGDVKSDHRIGILKILSLKDKHKVYDFEQDKEKLEKNTPPSIV